MPCPDVAVPSIGREVTMRKGFAALALVLIVGATAGPTLADDAKRLELARALLAQVHDVDAVRASVPLPAAQMRQTLAQQGEKSEDAEAFVAVFQKRLTSETGRYTDMMAEAYAREFDEEDLAAVIAFNATPLGQRFIAKRPALTQASFLAMRKLGQDVAAEVLDEMTKARGAEPHKM